MNDQLLTASPDEIESIVDNEFAKELCARIGYKFGDDRISRIAAEARYAMNAGLPAARAFAHAIGLEIDMYGDDSSVNPVGILSAP
jgi:hypothetical protein